MLRWYPSVLLRVVLELTFVPVAFFSIFVVMVLADASTAWVIGSWSGPGVTSDFWKIVGLLAVGWAILVLGWRGARTLFKWLVVPWHAGLAAICLLAAYGDTELALQGEAVGFSISLRLLAPLVFLVALGCALVWIATDLRHGASASRSVSPLRWRNAVAGVVAVVALAASGVAYAFGFDQVGTILGMAAMVACHETIRPVNPSAELHKAFVMEGAAQE